MATGDLIFACGFKGHPKQDVMVPTTTNVPSYPGDATVRINKTTAASGGGLRIRTDNAAAFPTGQRQITVSFYMKVATLPSAKIEVADISIYSGNDLYVNLGTGGALTIRFAGQTESATIATLSTGVWYFIEINCDTSGGVNHVANCRVDGGTSQQATATGLAMDMNGFDFGSVTATSSTYDIYYSDLVIMEGVIFQGDRRVVSIAPDTGAGDLDTNWAVVPNTTEDAAVWHAQGTDSSVPLEPAAAGRVVGELLVAMVAQNDKDAKPTITKAPNSNGDWTELADIAGASTELRLTAWWKIATPEDAAGTTTITRSAASTRSMAAMHAFYGNYDTTAPIGATATQANDSAISFTVPQITTPRNDCRVVAIGANNANNAWSAWNLVRVGSGTTAMTERTDATLTSGPRLGVAEVNFPTAGTTGYATATHTAVANVGILFAIQPPASTPSRPTVISEGTPDDYATYLKSSTANQVQRMPMTTQSISGTIKAVETVIRLGGNSATSRNVTTTLQNSSAIDHATIGTTTVAVNGFVTGWKTYQTSIGGTAWSQSELDNIRFKVTHDSSTNPIYWSNSYAYVVYEPSAASPATASVNSVDSAEAVSNPTILPGAVSISLTGNEIDPPVGQVENPTVTYRSTIVLTGHEINSAEAFESPTITTGGVSIVLTGNEIDPPTGQVENPTITSRSSIILTGNEINSAETVSNISVTSLFTILPNSINSVEAFDNPTVTSSASIVLTGNEIGSAESVSNPTITSIAFIYPDGVITQESVGTPSVSPGAVSILPNSVNSAEAFENPTVTTFAFIYPNSVSSNEAFDNPTITQQFNVFPDSIASAEAFENPTLTKYNFIYPDSINSAESVSNPLILNLNIIYPNDISTAEFVSSPTVVAGTAFINLNSIDSAEAFGNPTITTSASIFPNSINSAELVDNPVVLNRNTIVVNEIASSEAFDNPTVSNVAFIVPISIDSAESVSNPTVTTFAVINLNSVDSGETFDNPTLSTIQPLSIASEEVVEQPYVITGAGNIIPVSVDSQEFVESPTVLAGTAFINLDSVSSQETFDTPVVSSFNIISLDSVSSQEAFENPIITSSFTIFVDSILSGEQFENIIVSTTFQILVDGIATSEQHENPIVLPGGVFIIVDSISSAEFVDTPEIIFFLSNIIYPQSITSSVGFGSPNIQRNINVEAITSAESVSNPTIPIPNAIIRFFHANSIFSYEAFGSPQITNIIVRSIGGLTISSDTPVYPGIGTAVGTATVITGSTAYVNTNVFGGTAFPSSAIPISIADVEPTPLL